MSDHVVKRGLDIPIQGEATGEPVPLDPPATVAYSPTEIRGIVPRLAAREGDQVRVGTPLFHHKTDPRIVFVSPVAGRVAEVRRGRRRIITDIVIERAGDESEPWKQWTRAELGALEREQAIEAICATGTWPGLRTRPLDNVASPSALPQAIFVVATETGPLQPGASVLLAPEDAEPLQVAIDMLRKLTPGRVHLTQPPEGHPALAKLEGVERHTFSGPHPAGDPGVQVNLVSPVRGGGEVWYIRAWDAVLIGKALLTGRYPAERVYAAVGTGVKKPRFVRTLLGAPLASIAGEVASGDLRWIRGSILTGAGVDGGRWASMYSRAVHVLPEHVERSLMGWALPSLGLWSFHRAFVSGFTKPSKRYDMRPGVYGGERAMVPVGYYGKVVATPDVMPEPLFKSIIAGDLEESIQLGMLELSDEEAALCTYICPSKIEFDVLLREGLELYEKEA